MVKELPIGSTPLKENNAKDYTYRECQALIGQLKRLFGQPPNGARYKINSEPVEVVVVFDTDKPESMEYAHRVANNIPLNWDEYAIKVINNKVSMASINVGRMVGGPFDGKIHECMYWPPDYVEREDEMPPPEVREVSRLFSINFPEGAVYHWNQEKSEWQHQSSMSNDDTERHLEFFRVMERATGRELKPADPL